MGQTNHDELVHASDIYREGETIFGAYIESWVKLLGLFFSSQILKKNWDFKSGMCIGPAI